MKQFLGMAALVPGTVCCDDPLCRWQAGVWAAASAKQEPGGKFAFEKWSSKLAQQNAGPRSRFLASFSSAQVQLEASPRPPTLHEQACSPGYTAQSLDTND